MRPTKAFRAAVAALLLVAAGTRGFSSPGFGFRLGPQLLLPVGNGTVSGGGGEVGLYSTGGGLEGELDYSLFQGFGPALGGAFSLVPLTGAGSSMSLLSGSLGLAYSGFPLERLSLAFSATGGLTRVSLSSTDTSPGLSGIAPSWGARLGAGYRFGPSFDVSLGLGYGEVLGSRSPIFKGLSLALGARIGLDAVFGQVQGLKATVRDQSAIFPILWYQSAKTPIGTLHIVNQEAAEIRNLRVSFSAGVYSSRDAECGSVALLERGASVDLPLYADLNDKVLEFSEASKLQGVAKIEYKILDSARRQQVAATVLVNDRNAATWSDAAVLGAFVSPQDPVLLELSKYVAGLVRLNSISEIDKNLQYGMGLFEALRIYGVNWAPDPGRPYTSAIKEKEKVSYVQYPYQTLSYKTGDSDAVAILLAETLESVAIPAAIALLPDDCVVAFPLDMDEARARNTFETMSNFVFSAGKVWVPLRASMIRDGFLAAWKGGAELWKEAVDSGRPPVFVQLDEAWKRFQPVAVPNVDFQPVKPSETAVTLAFRSTLERFVNAELSPKIKRLSSRFQGSGTAQQHNGLGIVYAQYGMYLQARAEFEKASSLGSVAAIVNLANVAFLMKDYETAAAWFKKALDIQPDNKAALIGLARARYELDAYADADSLYARVKALDPALAERYSYISSKVDTVSVVRASSSAADRGGGMTWDEGQ